MSGASEIPEGVHVPGWFRQYLEARAAGAGSADVPPPPPTTPVIPPRGDAFSKICKDFHSMGEKPFSGSETFVEARNWLKEVEDLFGIFDLDDCKKVQLAAWLMKDEALFWWEVTNGERAVETWADFRGRFELKFLEESMYMERFLTLKQKNLTVKEYVIEFNK